MRYEDLLQPISDDEPCGPDLDEIGDDEFLNYTIPAEDKLPERYIEVGTGKVFDKTEIDLKSEVKTISGLLQRSRDIRLLCLEARFQCLAGKIIGFSECIIAIANLLEQFWDDVHPQGYDGDFMMRQNTVSALESRATIILPLQFATIITDRRHGSLTYRQYSIGTGKAEPAEDETVPDTGNITTALSSEDNIEEVTQALDAVKQTQAAFDRIRNIFIDKVGYDDAPSFTETKEILVDIQKLLESCRPELSENGDVADVETPDGDGEPAPGEDSEPVAAEAVADGVVASGAAISSHSEAASALFAAERYFSANEPSSPALILVHQSRMLVGQPLVRAMEALMPDSAERALIRFEPSLSFQLDMNRMRNLSDEATGTGAGVFDEASETTFNAATRAEAASIIAQVETFFKTTEPSSPIPMLLTKARGYLSRDFNSILKEIIVKNEEESD